MKAPTELLESFKDPTHHKRRATAIRRIAGGVRSEIESAYSTGLSSKELKVLRDAEALLGKLASTYQRAHELAKKKQAVLAKLEVAVLKEMEGNFCSLHTIPGKVALIAAVNSYMLAPGQVGNERDLDYLFRDTINNLAYRLREQAVGKSAQAAVGEAWQKFEAARSELENKHCNLIGKLSIQASKSN
jgi:hypothetical protein